MCFRKFAIIPYAVVRPGISNVCTLYIYFSATMIPKNATSHVEEEEEEDVDEFGAKDYRSKMELKKDHTSRPLWLVRN